MNGRHQAVPGLVLVVDDVPGNRVLAGAFLKRIGWQVATCDSAEAAQAFLATTLPEAMLLDVRMPGVSGDELVRVLRADPAYQDLRVVGYTAHAHPAEIEALKAAGFDDMLTKPSLMADMMRVLPDPRRGPLPA